MRQGIRKILVTGGAGFIGSAFVRLLLNGDRPLRGQSPFFKTTVPALVVVDKLTYAGDLARLKEIKQNVKFYKADICDQNKIEDIFKNEKPDVVVNFSAETHVDRSILDGSVFIRTNILGTQVLLDLSVKFKVKKVIHISTDEVYGDVVKGRFKETSPIIPSSPYSASKAAADLLIKSYIRTFDLPAVIARPSNNYGPWQYPEKLIPVIIYKAINNHKVPVYAKGMNVREWLYVDDCAGAIWQIVKKGRIGEVYNIGSGNERKNIEVVKKILDILEKPHSLIEYVKDRPGHDLRYALDFSNIRNNLGWAPQEKFDSGMKKTVSWYLDNQSWLNKKVEYLHDYWKSVYSPVKKIRG